MNKSDRNRVIAADVVSKAMQDPAFRSEFAENPKKILQDAGMDNLPDEVTLRVLENTLNRKHIVLPYSPTPSDTKENLITLLRETLPVPLPEGGELVLVQNTSDLQYILIPVIPPAYKGEITASHLDLLAATGWEAINLWTTANAAAEVNAAVWANVAAATEAAAAAVVVVAIGVVLV